MEERALRSASQKLGVNVTVELIEKTSEFLRLANMHRASLAGLGLSEPAKRIVCIQLACRVCKAALNQSECVKQAGLTRKNYVRASQAFERLLLGETSSKNGLRELAVRTGCLDAFELAQATLDGYKASVQELMNGTNRDDVNVSAPTFAAAALFCVCRSLKLKVSKQKLQKEAQCTQAELERRSSELDKFATEAVASWRSRQTANDIADNVESEQADGAAVRKGKRRRHKDADDEEDEVESAGVLFCSCAPDAEYFRWKKNLIKAAEEAVQQQEHSRSS